MVDVQAARRRLHGRVHETPLLSSTSIDALAGTQVLFKCEHLQKTGSFKARGATNAVSRIHEEGSAKGVITHSSGNHGLGLSFAAKQVGLPAIVVVPSNAPSTKREVISSYGAQIHLCEPTMKSREETCKQLAAEHDFRVVEPFNNEDVISGQGTLAAEILEQAPDVEAIFVAIGGGGLASGILSYLKSIKSPVEVYCVEPKGKQLKEVFKGEEVENPEKDMLDTVADGIRVRRLGSLCRPILQGHVHVVTVSDEEVIAAQHLIWHYLKQVVEPTAGVPLAGLLKLKPNHSKVAVVLCGGNVGAASLPGTK